MPTSGDYTSGDFWWIAVIMALTGCLIDATGWVMEKATHTSIQLDLLHKDNKRESLQYLCSCRWWFGFSTHVFGTALFSASLAFGDASLLMPLQSATLAFNTIFSWQFLKERLNTTQIIGTVIIIIGCAFGVVFGPKSYDISYTAADIQHLFQATEFLIFTVIIIVVAFVDFILFKFVVTPHGIFRLLSLIFMSAFFGSWNILFMKCFIEIVTASAQSYDIHEENVKHWASYVMFLLICFSKITSEYWREEALKEYPGNFVGSIYTLFFIVGVILFAAVFFEEFGSMTVLNIALFTVSVAVSFIGVAMLTFGDKIVYKQVGEVGGGGASVSHMNDNGIVEEGFDRSTDTDPESNGNNGSTEKQGLVDKVEVNDKQNVVVVELGQHVSEIEL